MAEDEVEIVYNQKCEPVNRKFFPYKTRDLHVGFIHPLRIQLSNKVR